MSYTINKTDGTILTTVEDGTLDTTTDLRLIGKNYSNFGEIFNENLIALLENFANSTAPTKPLRGQLWYDTSNSRLNVFDGSIFKSLAVLRISATAPSANSVGDMWFDSTNQQLYLYNGSTHALVGPLYTASQGQSGAFVQTVNGSDGSVNVVTRFMTAGTTLAYMSQTTFTPSPAISGFAQIKAGITFNSTLTDLKFQGTATNADEVDDVDSGLFMRLDVANTASGKLTINNDAGLSLGSNGFITLDTQSDDFVIYNQATNKDILFQVTDGSSTETVLTLDGSTKNVIVANDITAGNVIISDDLTVGNNFTAVSLTGTITTAAQPNITSVGTLTNLNVANNITAGNTVTALRLSGEIQDGTQTNITSVGTLGSLAVTGTATANTFSATTLTGTLSTPAQTNINQLGVLSGLQVSGSATFNNGINVASGVISGTIGTGSQTSITQVGTLTGLTVGGTATITTLALTNDLAVTEGGTGASTAADARTNLGAVNIAGDTMTGALTLSGVPTSTNHAATKGYTDSAIASSLTSYALKTYADQTAKWQGANKHVSTSAPTSGDGQDGDIWFVREA
jgi:hypothetical protein